MTVGSDGKATEAPYREDPREREIADLKAEVKRWKERAEWIGRDFDTLKAEYAERVSSLQERLKRGVVMRFVYRAFLVLVHLAWLCACVLFVVLPIYAVAMRHARIEWLWVVPGGLVLLAIQWAVIKAEQEA